MQVVGVFGLDDSVAFQFFAAPMLGSAANREDITRIISTALDHFSVATDGCAGVLFGLVF